MKRKGRPQSAKQRKASIRNFDIFRLRGMLATLENIQSKYKTPNIANIISAKHSINLIIREIKNA